MCVCGDVVCEYVRMYAHGLGTEMLVCLCESLKQDLSIEEELFGLPQRACVVPVNP